MVAITVLLCLLLVAAITDVARQAIYNWNTYPGIVAGLFLNHLGYGTLNRGWEALEQSVVGFLACGFVMLICFVTFELGGGDVKLIAMMGAFLGLDRGIEAMLWTFVLGSISAAAILIWQIGLMRIITKSAGHLLLMLRARTWVPLTYKEREPLKRGLFLAPSSFLAVCILAKSQML